MTVCIFTGNHKWFQFIRADVHSAEILCAYIIFQSEYTQIYVTDLGLVVRTPQGINVFQDGYSFTPHTFYHLE